MAFLFISAEAGSAWTILYPSYTVVVPEPQLKANAALAIPLDTSDFEDFVNDWLQMKKTSGIIDKFYNKWILGKKVEQKKQRWSIGRYVFNLWE